ncbi:hypothetical protein Dimus_025689 [Dionaea muscipula]
MPAGFLGLRVMPGIIRRCLHPSKRPLWIVVLLFLACLYLISSYLYPLQSFSAYCLVSSSGSCKALDVWWPTTTHGRGGRDYTDDEMASRVVIKEILNSPLPWSETRKIAFMFLTPGPLPFEKLWELFFQGHEGKFSVYIHASQKRAVRKSQYFKGRDIRSDKVEWGQVSMVDAEKRLLANALQDPDNHHFVLLSDSCVPLHDFSYVYHYLIYTNISFVDSFRDPGPHGNGRYSKHMLPEVPVEAFRKGAQWFTLKRKHALIVMADSLYYSKFRDYCRPDVDGHNCYSDEHYLPTLLHMIDPAGMSNWSVTHVDWSQHLWHPRSYTRQDVSFELLRNITVM